MNSIYKINDLIFLKLEDNKTHIYVGGQKFLNCKYLLLMAPLDPSQYYQITSIDQAEEYLNTDHELNKNNELDISPEQEFWAHCSNIQAWVENNYDTRLLHRNLAFPLLYQLATLKDPVALHVFREEIIKRIKEGHPQVLCYLAEEGFFNYLPEDYLRSLTKNSQKKLIRILFNTLNNSDNDLVFGSLFLFQFLHPILTEDMVEEFLRVIKSKKGLISDILFFPQMIAVSPEYVNANFLSKIRMIIIEDILKTGDLSYFKESYPDITVDILQDILRRLQKGERLNF